MKIKILRSLVFGLALYATAFNYAYASDAVWDNLNESMEEINTDKRLSINIKVEKLDLIYKEKILTKQKSAPHLSSSELHALFRAAYMLTTYTLYSKFNQNSLYLKYMQDDLQLLREKREALDVEYILMYKAFIAARRFNDAKRINAYMHTTAMPPIPRIKVDESFNPLQPSHFYLTDDPNTILLKSTKINLGNRIVIVSGCHFSEDAARAIYANPQIRQAFIKSKAIWLMPANGDFDLNGIRRWNSKFPEQEITISYKNSSWKGIDFSRIPTFYFLKNGEIIGTQVGWTSSGKIPESILTSLKKFGFLNKK